MIALRTLLLILGLSVCNASIIAAPNYRTHKITTPSGRTAYPEKQYSIRAVEIGIKKQEKEERLKKDAELRGEIYLPKVEIPSFPTRRDFAAMKALLKNGDQIWSFHGLDSGWIILRGEVEIYQLVTDHDY